MINLNLPKKKQKVSHIEVLSLSEVRKKISDLKGKSKDALWELLYFIRVAFPNWEGLYLV